MFSAIQRDLLYYFDRTLDSLRLNFISYSLIFELYYFDYPKMIISISNNCTTNFKNMDLSIIVSR